MLDNEIIHDATRQGVEEAFANILPSPDKVLQAISDGVQTAIWNMITNATSAPCADFYATIKEAATSAFEKVALEREELDD